MKQNLLVVLGLILLLAACSPTQAAKLPEFQPSAPVSPLETKTLITKSTAEFQPMETIAPAPTITEPIAINPTEATSLTPSITSTSQPQTEVWRWIFDPIENNILAVNFSGKRRIIGLLDPDDAYNGKAIPLNESSAVLFIAGETLKVFLLNLDGMQKISLPPAFPYVPDWAFSTLAVTAASNKYVSFIYSTRQSEQVGSRAYPNSGPAFLINLSTLTTRLVEEDVFFDPFVDQRLWFFPSTDGRYLRYLSGDTEVVKVREMDLENGADRTIVTTTRSPYSVSASPDGELWFLRHSDLILSLDGNQKNFSDPERYIRSLVDGKSISLPPDCAAPCPLEVFTPFGDEPIQYYTLPWSIESAFYFPLISRLLPGGDLLFVGSASASLVNPPTTLSNYPSLLDDDNPVFRLSLDGGAEMVGVYRQREFASSNRVLLSADRRFLLLKSIDQADYFMYDADSDQTLFRMPIRAGLKYFYALVEFFDEGILVRFTTSTPEQQYTDFYYLFRFIDGEVITWEDAEGTTLGCPDLLEDGSLVCWIQRPDLNYDLIQLDPVSGEKYPLVENIWLLETVP